MGGGMGAGVGAGMGGAAGEGSGGAGEAGAGKGRGEGGAAGSGEGSAGAGAGSGHKPSFHAPFREVLVDVELRVEQALHEQRLCSTPYVPGKQLSSPRSRGVLADSGVPVAATRLLEWVESALHLQQMTARELVNSATSDALARPHKKKKKRR